MARKDSGKKVAKKGQTRGAKRVASSKPPKGRAGANESSAWPTERETLFRPDRLKYVRKQIKNDGCVFCQALKKGVKAESLVLYSGEHAMVVMNKFPYNPGHLLVLPKRHCGDLLDLTPEEVGAIAGLTQHCVAALKAVYEPAGFNVGLNLGASAGAGIPEHLHTHIVPRWNGDTNFFPLLAKTKVVVETLEQTFERLLPYFDDAYRF